ESFSPILLTSICLLFRLRIHLHTRCALLLFPLFFFNRTATPAIYTLSLHDALPICAAYCSASRPAAVRRIAAIAPRALATRRGRSEEHTSELQSPYDLVCRLLLEKKKKNWCSRCRIR